MLAILAVVGLVFAATFGIVESQKNSSREHIITGDALPAKATNITDVGNGWHEFTYKDKRYLYHYKVAGYGAQECIVQIEKQ